MIKLICAAVSALLITLPATKGQAADTYPKKPVTLIIPYSPGAFFDLVGRRIASAMELGLGQPVIVENRTGASGMVGGTHVVGAAPDGYTLLMGGMTLNAILPNIDPDAAAKFQKLKLAAFLPGYSMILVTSPRTGIKTVADLIERLKDGKELVNYLSVGPATPAHLAGAYFSKLAGGNAEAIQYKGNGEALADLLSGTLTYGFDAQATAEARIKEGTLIGLATATNERLRTLPELPTMAEAGLPDFTKVNWTFWTGVFAPADTPDDIIKTINAAINDAVAKPEVQEAISKLGGRNDLVGKSVAEAAAIFERDRLAWGQALQTIRAGKPN
jgi:tripartite-type tricarboxylate transporter receptor subunit TctC